MTQETILFIQQLFNGLSQGAIYALIALGYTMVFGVLRFINFAHGDLLMVGAFVGIFMVSSQIGPMTDAFSGAEMPALVGAMPVFRTIFLLLVGVLLVIDVLLWLNRGRRGSWFLLRPFFLIPLVTAALALFLPLLGRLLFAPPESALPHHGWAIFVFLSAMLICAGFGMSIEQVCYRPLRAQPRITVLITAIGVSLLLESLGQFAFGTQPQMFPSVVENAALDFTQPWAFGLGSQTMFTIHFPQWFIDADFSITRLQVIQFIATFVLLGALVFIVRWTKIGMAMRALSVNPAACSLMGVNTNFVIAVTFGLGSALAGAAGVLTSAQQNAEPLMGINYGLKAFVAAVLGGIGHLPGAVVGGLLIGALEALTAEYLSSTYRDAVAFTVLIVILLVRPAGLFGKNIREKV